MRNEQFRDLVLLVKQDSHLRHLDAVKTAVTDRGRRGYAQGLTCETPLTQEISAAQYGNDRFPTLGG